MEKCRVSSRPSSCSGNQDHLPPDNSTSDLRRPENPAQVGTGEYHKFRKKIYVGTLLPALSSGRRRHHFEAEPRSSVLKNSWRIFATVSAPWFMSIEVGFQGTTTSEADPELCFLETIYLRAFWYSHFPRSFIIDGSSEQVGHRRHYFVKHCKKNLVSNLVSFFLLSYAYTEHSAIYW